MDDKNNDLRTEEATELDSEEMTSSLKSKLSNFWYFYKWQTILCVIIAIGVIAALFQVASNDAPDAAIMYVGPSYLTPAAKDEITEAAAQYMIDYNGDGVKSLHLLDISVSVVMSQPGVSVPPDLLSYAAQTNADAQKRFTTEVTAGDSLIYILEESFYRRLVELDALAPLDSVLDADMIPQSSEEFGAKLSDIPFFEDAPFSAFLPAKDCLYVCIRRPPSDSGPKYGRTMEYWNSNKVLFRSIFAYRKG